jgi:putative MATE family efflux protein
MQARTGWRLGDRDRRIIAIGLPALATVLLEPLYTIVDTAIVGHLGTAPLGGLALASTVLNTSFWVFNFLSFGTTSRVAFLTGRKDERGAAAVAGQGFWLCGCIGIPVALLLAFGARPIAGLMGGQGDVLRAAVTYLRISAVGTPFVLLSLVGNGYLRGVADTRTPLRVVAAANVANVVLEVVLVYGFHLGVAGSAWGTVAAQVMAAAWFAVLVGRRIRLAGVRLRPVAREMRRLAVVGRHLFVRTGALLATLTLATSVAARLGPVTLAAHQVALQVWLFVTMGFDGLAIPAQTITGTLLGEGAVDEARANGRRLCALGLWSGAAVGALIVALSGILPHVFTNSGRVAHQATVALIVVGILQVPDGVLFVLDGVLMGASDFRFLQASTISGLVGFLPVGTAVLAWHRLGIVGLWSGLAVWLLLRLAVNAARYRGSTWLCVAHSA